MNRTKFVAPQQMLDGTPICTCCNTNVAGGEKRVTVHEHILHDDCGGKLAVVNTLKEVLIPVIEALPQSLLKGSNILQRLETVYAVSSLKAALKDLCAHFVYKVEKEKWPAKQIQQAIASIIEAVEGSRLEKILIPVLKA